MENILLVASILSLHYPIGLFKDTDRRYKRMKFYGKDFDYNIRNNVGLESNPIYSFPGVIIAFFASLVFAYFPLKELIELNWYWVALINLMIFWLIAPTLAFITTPMMGINHRDQLKRKTYIFVVIGILLELLAGII